MLQKKLVVLVALIMLAGLFAGCNSEVKPGTVGRVNTSDGWSADILKPGYWTCWGRDHMYTIDVTNKTFKESMNILVGGKVNLKVDFSVRVRANADNNEMIKKAFESVPADGDYKITVDQLYQTFLQMKAQAVPRQIFEVQPDIQTAVANSPKLAMEVRKQISDLAKSTPLIVEDAEITNYDWPDAITKAQEELVKVQLSEAKAEAEVRAALKQAEGQLKVEEANKLVEMKKAEAVAESIDIIKTKLAGSPEYLMWHQIRVMGEAAHSNNNAFFFYPYTTEPKQVSQMVSNASLAQMLRPDGPKLEKKPSAEAEAADILKKGSGK